MKGFFYKLSILTTRSLTIGIRFIFNLLILKALSLEDYGVYSIFYTTVTISAIFIGLDYYQYNIREVVSEKKSLQRRLLGEQFLLHIIIHLIFIPASYFLLKEIIPTNLILIFYLILILEHLSLEGYRLLIAFSKPLFANILQFVRMGLWCLIILLLTELKIFEFSISLTVIINYWLYFETISFILILIYFLKNHLITLSLSKKVFDNIISGLKISIIFFASTLIFKVIEFSSRYFLDFYTTKENVGIFTFFSSLSNLVFVTIHTVTIIVIYPKLIRANKLNEEANFKKLSEKLLREILFLSTVLCVLLYFFSPFLLELIGKQELLNNINVLNVLLIGTFFFMLSYYPHHMMYIRGKEKLLLYSSILSLVINLTLNFILVPKYGVIGAAISTSAGFMALFLIKTYLHIHHKRIKKDINEN
ncbi:lipopolysaccharide biosynthesis protein [Marivirga sp.]|uniref:lipopolysaccharide biosynthesis protein n=1 Tax=Marivirga sp. TaxID=2018662 RepID=UPI002D7FA436|nr:polysaccharide biosynthesis C-terminal domain-containing protein [Marivirga sp.]HET8858752.1 polysaccharide biosynthesis C-terminal domain-containing protein [Marivirga sp.]